MNARPLTEMNVAYVSTAPPRRCGIASYTSHLAASVSRATGGRPSLTVAVVDTSDVARGLPRAHFHLRRDVKGDYVRAAKFLNRSDAHLVHLHHEFSIYGGSWGRNVTALLERVEKPVVTTCHTILSDPAPEVRFAFEDLLRHSDRIICMSPSGATTLRETYGVPEERVRVIPLGVPDLPFVAPDSVKPELGLQGRMVLLTFGLLGPNKGIESTIGAMPRVVSRCPRTVYLVVGQTHPVIRDDGGEAYRATLEKLARELGVERNVVFHDRYVDDEELARFLLAADVCITPYLGAQQSSSSVLAHALAVGKAVVSTRYTHAVDLLSDGSGLLVEARNSEAMAEALLSLLEDDALRSSLREKAYLRGRPMVWDAVGRAHVELFDEAVREAPRKLSEALPMAVTGPALRYELLLASSYSEHRQRLARVIGMVRQRQWRVLARKIVRNLNPLA